MCLEDIVGLKNRVVKQALAFDHCPRDITSKNSGPRRPVKKRFMFPISFLNIPADLGGMLIIHRRPTTENDGQDAT